MRGGDRGAERYPIRGCAPSDLAFRARGDPLPHGGLPGPGKGRAIWGTVRRRNMAGVQRHGRGFPVRESCAGAEGEGISRSRSCRWCRGGSGGCRTSSELLVLCRRVCSSRGCGRCLRAAGGGQPGPGVGGYAVAGATGCRRWATASAAPPRRCSRSPKRLVSGRRPPRAHRLVVGAGLDRLPGTWTNAHRNGRNLDLSIADLRRLRGRA